MELFKSHFAVVKAAGLGITLHIAEVRYHVTLWKPIRSKRGLDDR